MSDFTSVRADRGRLTNARTGDSLVFAINPNTINMKSGSNLAKDAIPGSSHKLVRWMSGKDRSISFTLALHGEIQLRFGMKLNNGNDPAPGGQPKATTGTRASVTYGADGQAVDSDPASYSIDSYIKFLESFTFPVDPEDQPGNGGVGCDIVLFSFGPSLRSVPCIVEDLSIKLIEFDQQLNPVQATVDVSLERYVTETVFSHEVWRRQ
jgi:hypothetical protein